MEENKKQIDWKNVGWRFLQALIILFLNTSSIIFFVNMWLEKPISIDGKQYITTNIFNDNWYDKPLLILFAIIGVVLTILFIKFLYKNNKEKKDKIEYNKNEDKRLEKLNKSIEKLFRKE